MDHVEGLLPPTGAADGKASKPQAAKVRNSKRGEIATREAMRHRFNQREIRNEPTKPFGVNRASETIPTLARLGHDTSRTGRLRGSNLKRQIPNSGEDMPARGTAYCIPAKCAQNEERTYHLV